MPGKKTRRNGQAERQAQMQKPFISSALLPYLILAAIFVLFSYIRIRLASFPLERDEGEYAYFGQLILHGIPPYQLAYNLKLPGTYAAYALIMALFGQTMQGIRFGLLLFNLGSLVFIFLIMKRLFSAFSALVAVAVASILFISLDLQGQAAHATHFVTFFMLAGAWLLLTAIETPRRRFFLLSGVLMGLAFLMKQSGIFFPIFGGVMILVYGLLQAEKNWAKVRMRLIPYAVGAVFPLLLTFLILFLAGVFHRFWFWTFVYPKVYGSAVPLSAVWGTFMRDFPPVTETFRASWILAALGFASLFFYRGKLTERIFLGFLLIFSFLNAVPGFYFRPHYFLPMVPAVGMLAGFFIEFLHQWILGKFRHRAYVTGIGFLVLVIPVLNGQKDYYFHVNPVDLCRAVYGGNYFAEAVPVADYIRANTKEDDRILVFGSEPEIYFYADRKSATGYVYMYDLTFPHPYRKAMQKEMMNEVEAVKPKFIVVVACDYSWRAVGDGSDVLFTWIDSYAKQNKYLPAGLVEYHYPEPSDFSWGNDALTHKPKTQNYMVILKRQE